MKRLQFRHHIDLFSNRDEALDFLKNITDISHTASTIFGASLYAEPMVAKYKDESGNIQILVAISMGLLAATGLNDKDKQLLNILKKKAIM